MIEHEWCVGNVDQLRDLLENKGQKELWLKMPKKIVQKDKWLKVTHNE